MLKRNKIVSYMNICMQLSNFALIPLLLLMLTIAFINSANTNFTEGILIAIITLLSCQFILIPILRVILNVIGFKKVVFSENKIHYRGMIINSDQDCRVIYSKINLNTILSACAGELVLIKNNKQIILGVYNRYEIKKIKKYISNIYFAKDYVNK